jgi:predicted dehydrogenase
MKRVAVIGAGVWGRQLLRVLRTQIPEELAIVCDVNEENLAVAHKRYPDLDQYTDYKVLLDRDDVQALVVAAPPDQQEQIALDALQAGKDLFVDVPHALSVKMAEQLATVAEERKLIFMVGHIPLYHPAVSHLRKMVADGFLGQIQYMQAARAGLGRGRQTKNVLWSYAPNDIALAIDLLQSDPVTVSVTGSAFVEPGSADVIFASLHFGDGSIAHLHASWLAPHRERRVMVVGSRQTALFDDVPATEKIRIYNKISEARENYQTYGEYQAMQAGDLFIPKLPAAEPLAMECQHFLTCVEKREQPLTDGEFGVRVIRVLEAAQQSLDAGGAPVSV